MRLSIIIKKFALENALESGGIASKNSVLSRVFAFDSELKKNPKAVSRWVALTLREVNRMSPEKQARELKRTAAILK